MNLAAAEDMDSRFPDGDVALIESRGDNLTLTFSPALVGFNPVLTAIALGAVFYRSSPRVVLYTLFATVLSVIVQGAMML